MTTQTATDLKPLVDAVQQLCKEIRRSTHGATDINADMSEFRVLRASYLSRNVCQQETLDRVEQLVAEMEKE
jgi:hypothetical protein